MMQYRYDPDAVIEVTETLTLYTIEESFLLQQAAALYHKEHPEVVINIEKAFSKMESYTAEPDYNQIYQELNTKLMAGEDAQIRKVLIEVLPGYLKGAKGLEAPWMR